MVKNDGKFCFGPFELDAAEHRLLRDGVDLPLQLKAFELLCVLVRHAGRLLTKEELLRQVWPDSTVEENNLNKNISLLRKILGGRDGGESYIETVPRVGFRFSARVAPFDSVVCATQLPGNGTAPQREKSVAVLYFENLSGDREDEYLRDGMTEDVITELAKIRGLRLFPRSSVLAFRDTPLPVTDVGRRLGAAFVLEGSIRRAGCFLRITARLAETTQGHTLWTERYDRGMEDVFAIQDEIARNIARALRVMLTEKEKHEIEKVPTTSIQAYDFYLRGRQYFYQMRRQGLEYARQMFARAMFIDPQYARAHAGVADCCSFLYMWYAAGSANLNEALAASRRAVELDPQSSEAHASLGFAQFLSRNYDGAREQFETALELDSELFEAYYFYGRCCFAQGQYEKAAGLFARASQACPTDYQAPAARALCLRALGRIAEAGEVSRDCLEKVEQHLQLHPGDVRAVSLGSCALHNLGDETRALEWTARALAMDPEQVPVLYNAACTYAILGHKDKALDCLAHALRQGFRDGEWLQHDPELESLRGHSRFKALVEGLETDRMSFAP